MLRWEAVENGEPRYLTDGQAALLLLDWGTPQEEVARILRERSPWSLRRETQSLFRLDLQPLALASNGAPLCPYCLAGQGGQVRMRGPIPATPDDGAERVFICDRCSLTMKDRRGSPRR